MRILCMYFFPVSPGASATAGITPAGRPGALHHLADIRQLAADTFIASGKSAGSGTINPGLPPLILTRVGPARYPVVWVREHIHTHTYYILCTYVCACASWYVSLRIRG